MRVLGPASKPAVSQVEAAGSADFGRKTGKRVETRIVRLESFPRLEEIAHKAVWGTDWPSPGSKSMNQNVDQSLQLPISEEWKRTILYDNAGAIWS